MLVEERRAELEQLLTDANLAGVARRA